MWDERNRPRFYKPQISGDTPAAKMAPQIEPPFPEPHIEQFEIDPTDGIEPETPT